jgi:hypothetical protein
MLHQAIDGRKEAYRITDRRLAPEVTARMEEQPSLLSWGSE